MMIKLEHNLKDYLIKKKKLCLISTHTLKEVNKNFA